MLQIVDDICQAPDGLAGSWIRHLPTFAAAMIIIANKPVAFEHGPLEPGFNRIWKSGMIDPVR